MEKTYEGFFKKFFKKEKQPTETTKEIYEKNKLIIEDCFVDLKDVGFSVDVYNYFYNPITIHITKLDNKNRPRNIIYTGDDDYDDASHQASFIKTLPFSCENIIETLLFAIPYLTSEFPLKIYNIEILKEKNPYNYKNNRIKYTSFDKKTIEDIRQITDAKEFYLEFYSKLDYDKYHKD